MILLESTEPPDEFQVAAITLILSLLHCALTWKVPSQMRSRQRGVLNQFKHKFPAMGTLCLETTKQSNKGIAHVNNDT